MLKAPKRVHVLVDLLWHIAHRLMWLMRMWLI